MLELSKAMNRGGVKLLVAVENYPKESIEGAVSHQFVHVRNKYYRSVGFDVEVLNFSTDEDYRFEGIKVIAPHSFKTLEDTYDLLLCHQPNLKHHLPFCVRHGNRFKSMVFFFHGHEVLKISKSYPKPYPYIKRNKLAQFLRDCYDELKFVVWRCYFSEIRNRAKFVFVSDWMYREFKKWLRVEDEFLGENALVIPNCIGEAFENSRYDVSLEKKYDFVTVRGNLDTSKYAIDLVISSARRNPECSFLIIGKGEIFEHYGKPENVTWIARTMNHEEIVRVLNSARCALMPTRTDAQGLMMCEMASFGIPLISSDIAVCREVLGMFSNVKLLANDDFAIQLENTKNNLPPVSNLVESPFSRNMTIGREVQLLDGLIWDK